MQEGGGFRLPSLDSPSYPLTPFHSRRQSRPRPPPAPKRRTRLGSRVSPGLIVNEQDICMSIPDNRYELF